MDVERDALRMMMRAANSKMDALLQNDRGDGGKLELQIVVLLTTMFNLQRQFPEQHRMAFNDYMSVFEHAVDRNVGDTVATDDALRDELKNASTALFELYARPINVVA